MKIVRIAFYGMAVALLAGVTGGLFWHFHAGKIKNGMPMGSMPGSMAEASGRSMSEPAPKEPSPAPFQISPERLQSIGLRTGVVERKPVHDEIRVTGNVMTDETRISFVQVRFSGWIQRVYADATYRYLHKGQPLFTIYSPDLAATEEEYVVAKRNWKQLAHSSIPGVAEGAASLLRAAADRLNQWGVPQKEISRLKATGRARRDLVIDSPVSGYITERAALPNAYVEPATRIYTVADLSTVWVFAEVFQNDLEGIKPGEPAALTVDTYPGRIFRGRVDFIYPEVDPSTRTVRVRLVFPNPNLALFPGMFVNVSLEIPLGDHLVIPVSGVLQSGIRQLVFLYRGGGYLEPREVRLGRRANGDFIVLKGLKEGDRIVTSANFLIDSESQLQAAAGMFAPPPPGAGSAAAMNASRAGIVLQTEPSPPRKGNNRFRVNLTDSHGSPIPDAEVSLIFFMRAMPAMGMPAMHMTTVLQGDGHGSYSGLGKLESGGTWQVTVLAKKNGKIFATQSLSLNAEGGM